MLTRTDVTMLDVLVGLQYPTPAKDERVSMSTNQPAASFFDELATFFASGPSPSAILEFRPSPATVERARQLLELNRSGTLDEASRIELDQFEMAESLMRLVKARIHAGQARERS
jgi:hypothetical protein